MPHESIIQPNTLCNEDGKRERTDETLTNPTRPPSSSRRRRRRRRKRVPPPPSPEWRDWSSPSGAVLLAIFSRIPHADNLHGAGQVCAAWRRVAVSEPALWRRIELFTNEDEVGDGPLEWRGMASAAVGRSAGGCESFRGRADMDFLAYLAGRSPSLMSIHVTSGLYMPERSFITDVIQKLPLLERLVLSSGDFPATPRVMGALLDHCPCLELLDAGGCTTDNVMSGRLRERCEERIRHLRLPPVEVCGCCIRRAQEYADEHDDSDEQDDD